MNNKKFLQFLKNQIINEYTTVNSSLINRTYSKVQIRSFFNSSRRCVSATKSFCRSNVTTTPLPIITEKYPDIKTHEQLWRFSVDQPDLFWSVLARNYLKWKKDFSIVSEINKKEAKFKWFSDGFLNVSENCVDRHAEVDPERVALIWEKDEPGKEEKVTYGELKDLVCRIANVLKDSGVKKGDRIAIYLPVRPLAVACMLACARIGALHSVIFAGFSSEAIATRIQDAQAEIVITMDKSPRGGKTIELLNFVSAAVKKCPQVKRVFVASESSLPAQLTSEYVDFNKAISLASTECEAESLSAEDFLFLLYTSGSTGKPKGVAHTSAGYLLYAATTHKHVFDCHVGDIFGCVADIGWITGHSYVVYGPLANGVTSLLFESTPTYPDPGRYWETISRLGVNQFYCAPTALRLLLRYGNSWPEKYDMSSLRSLGCVGEPLNHEAWQWYNDIIGKKKCSVIDTWWQTETGGVMISPRPSSPGAEIIPGMPMRPFFGIEPALFNSIGEEVTENKTDGALCIKSIWPGIARTIYGDHQRFIDTYFKPHPELFFSGDGAIRDENNHIHITGRMDDVINVTGHRLGTAEVEDVINEHVSIAETAVVGFPHDIKGEGIYAFVILKKNVSQHDDEIRKDLKLLVKSNIAAYAVPDNVLFVPGLPKTRSGKIMRRILRKIAAGKEDELGDISTLADPSIVADILKMHKNALT